MALFLLEFPSSAQSRDDLGALFQRVAQAVGRAGGEFIEAQVPNDLQRVYVVIEHGDKPGDEAGFQRVLDEEGVPARTMVQVRLLGATLDQVKASRGAADYLVEWDFPAGLTMEAYLARKKANAPRYAQVPDVRFLRTYVCEDMSKCLCFYLAHDEAAVRRAREVVSAPVTRLAGLAGPAETTDFSGTPARSGIAGGHA